MTRVCFGTLHSIFIYLTIVSTIDAVFQDFMNLQHPRSHLPDTKFGYGEYSEYSENDERKHGPDSAWDRIPQRNVQHSRFGHTKTESPSELLNSLDPNIAWDSQWVTDLSDMGQLSAVDIDPEGNIAIFSRGERIWGLTTFDDLNRFSEKNSPIKHHTITLFNKKGKKILQWGKNMFYLPHGLTIDHEGNYWVTDVALHQVLKFDAEDIRKNWQSLKHSENRAAVDIHDYNSRFNQSILKPSMVLGEAFQPGHDRQRFCKPTDVAIARNGDFFVSDGYCNSRIIKFNKNGERILEWGRPWTVTDNLNTSPPSYALFVPHSLALAEDQNLIYVADREDGRVMSYSAKNGTFHREYKHGDIGPKIYAIAYALDKIYLVNGPEVYTSHNFHVRGFVIDTKSGSIVSQFAPGSHDMIAPHDIAVSDDGTEIYAVEVDAHKVYRFTQDTSKEIARKTNSSLISNATLLTRSHHEPGLLTDDTSIDVSSGQNGTGQLVLSIIISSMILIGLCLALAAVVARCQRRGCLLSVRKKAYWEAERRENFKLSNLLDPRQSKSFKILEKRPNTRDFSKLSTEPETSEDERLEDSLVI